MRARDRVIGGLLMRGEANTIGERSGDGVPMRGNMQRVPACKPKLQRERNCEEGEECGSEC